MADYKIISETSKVILEMFQNKLCENNHPVMPENVKFITPSDTSVDYHVGLYLYDIRELVGYQRTAPIIDGTTRTYPPRILELYFMLFINPKAQNKIEADTEHDIFGRALQIIYDAGILKLPKSTDSLTPEDEVEFSVSFVNQTFDDKVKIWSAFQSPYRMTACFMVAPVLLPSRRVDTISRVTDAKVTTKQNTQAPPTSKG